ncbi:eCIS core domain-containing protein [Cupriavidus consociatus]|uniref:eCIS core domain-containing protein n=1 Tax=Cupriavidus consociatus TaxID=2821357 RepID=UPI001AE9EF8D|nr:MULTISPECIES: DUF4157 domain-containing protein [unclassified Cupriavidus]MBP0622471.1 DUF4157 domain-containing protein [Cupriavidus sp. LEh25]MDK2659157.1 DUF4157 domain-containing protein [Cupriavidus sp. LEh21]
MEATSPKFARRPSERPAPETPRAASRNAETRAQGNSPAATPAPPPALPAYAQPPARVSQPGEGIEREAEQHANAVAPLTVPDPTPTSAPRTAPGSAAAGGPLPSSATSSASSLAAAPGSPAAAEAGAFTSPASQLPAYAAGRVDARRGRGEPIPKDARGTLEGHFGRDFADVRIHTDAEAARLTTGLNARAFTSGRDVYLAPGAWAPDTTAGLHLLAHELTHVVQQDGQAAAVLARAVDPNLDTRFHETDRTPAALTALERLEIPAVKARHLPLYSGLASAGNLKRIKGYGRDGANQRTVWNQLEVPADAVRTRLGERNIPVPADDSGRVRLKPHRGARLTSKRISELQTLLRIPAWDRNGRAIPQFQVDHIVELQVSGQMGSGVGNSVQNMELLDQPSNSSSGGTIRSGIYRKVDAYLDTFDPKPDRGAVLRQHDVVFSSAAATGAGSAAGASAWWTKTEIEEAEPLRTASPPNATEDGVAQGTAGEFILTSGPGGITVGRFRHSPGSAPAIGTAHARALAGLRITAINLSDTAGTPSGPVGSLAAEWDLPADWQPETPAVTISLSGDGEYRGYPSAMPALNVTYRHLSPVSFTSVSAEDGEISADGELTPSIPILNAPVTVRLRGRDLSFSLDYGPEQISLPIPRTTIDDAYVSVFYSTTRGLGLGGQVFFSIEGAGSGELAASVSTAGGVQFEGGFTFERSLFDRARVRAWWRGGALGAEGTIGIDTPDKIRGIKSATATVSVTEGAWSFTGSAELSVPGVKEAGISINQGENGLTIAGDIALAANPAIRSGSIRVECKKDEGDWKVSATGTAQPAIPGVDSELTVTYDDGAFDAQFSGAFARGMLSGQVTVGATNRSIGEDGRPSGDAAPDAPIIVYGSGSATIQIAPWLQGTAGIRLDPNGEITVSGEIALPNQLEIFSRLEYDKRLFGLSTQIPIIPGIVAEVGGNLSANASIGPGAIDQLRIGIEYNPSHEENTHVTGDAHLNVPAQAGLRLGARAGIGLGITGASATGGLEIGGTLGIAGAAEAGIHIDWMPSQGLAIDAEAALHAQPTFRFDVSGYVAVTALGASLYDERFELAAVELGSGLEFGVRFPITYREGEPFDVSLDDLEFEVPEVDPAALVDQLGAQIF